MYSILVLLIAQGEGVVIVMSMCSMIAVIILKQSILGQLGSGEQATNIYFYIMEHNNDIGDVLKKDIHGTVVGIAEISDLTDIKLPYLNFSTQNDR